jgi:hypothetical protein
VKVKGCKKYRDVLVGKHSVWYEEQEPRNIGTVRNLWGGDEEPLDRQLVELNLGLWKTGLLSAGFKNCLFKLVQGRLWFNAGLAHFTEEEPWCTFCGIIAKRELDERGITLEQPEYDYYVGLCPRETLHHIFWECEHVQPLIQTFFRHICSGNGFLQNFGGRDILKSEFFGGNLKESKAKSIAAIMWIHYVKYYVYTCRYKKQIPCLHDLMNDFEDFCIKMGNAGKWGRWMNRLWELYI